MAWNRLIDNIESNIKANGTGDITGQTLQSILLDMIAELSSAGSAFNGFVVPDCIYSFNSDSKFFVVAKEDGDYANIGYEGTLKKFTVLTWNPDTSAWMADTTMADEIFALNNHLGELDEKVEQALYNLAGKNYGAFPSASDLPEGNEVGYAFVGEHDPFGLYLCDGNGNWEDTGVEITGMVGPQGEQGEQGEQGPQGEQGEQGKPGRDAVNPFKGWWPDLATLKVAIAATTGDSAYVKDADPATTWSIYVYDSTASSDNYWTDSGRKVDPALDVSIDNTPTYDSNNLVTSGGVADKVASTVQQDIAFDGGNYYIPASGVLTANANWVATQYIPVSKGDKFTYKGTPGTTSRAVAAYSFDGNDYTLVELLLGTSATAIEKFFEIVDDTITHIVASCQKSYTDRSLTVQRDSALSRISDNLGNFYTDTYISQYTQGNYVDNTGAWKTGNSLQYVMLNVKAGDVIKIYDYMSNYNVSAIAKKLTDTTFEPIVVVSAGDKIGFLTYTATEDMTVCVSSNYQTGIRQMFLYSNKINQIDYLGQNISNLKNSVNQRITSVDNYDLKLGYMFENIACIGDSMSVGSLSTESSEAPNNNMGASWLSMLAKRWGCLSRMHYAVGGSGCYTWLNGNTLWGLSAMLADEHIYNAYLIAYGHNDGGENYSGVGTAEDTAAEVTITDNTPSCASGNTFCAYYKAIIDQIRTKAPHAMIFCLSEYDNVVMGKQSGAYRQAIIDVADWYYENGDKLVHHLETGGVPNSDMQLGTHYSTIGYLHIARMVDLKANECLYSHMTDQDIKEFGVYNNEDNRYEQTDTSTI